MQELSLRQQYQRLTRVKANAVRAGQATPKLDVTKTFAKSIKIRRIATIP